MRELLRLEIPSMLITLVYLILILVLLALIVLSAFGKPMPPQSTSLIDILVIAAAAVALINFTVELWLAKGGSS